MRSEIPAFFTFSIFTVAIAIAAVCTPALVSAKDMQADAQCPAGGVVGQTCKDNTNGYTTSGHCTHIGICKADSWPKSPKGCGGSGNIYSPTGDCPKGPQYGQGTPTKVAPTPTSTQYNITTGASDIAGDIFDTAFSDNSSAPVSHSQTVSTTSLDGIEYFISDGEALASGAPLTEQAPQTTQERATLSLGEVSGLQASRNVPAGEVSSGEYGKNYVAPIGTFTSGKTQKYVQSADLTSRIVTLGTDAVQGFSSGIIQMLMSASGLNTDTSSDVVAIRPYESMYDQAEHSDVAPFVEPPWQKVSQTPLSYMFAERASNVNRLLREAVSDLGAGSYDLFTADLAKSRKELGSAAKKTTDALGLIGNLAASVALRVIMGN